MGDSPIDIHAANVFASNFNKCFYKTVKFEENHILNDINQQLNLYRNIFSDFSKDRKV